MISGQKTADGIELVEAEAWYNLRKRVKELQNAMKDSAEEFDTGSAEKLKALYASYLNKHDFKPGDLVTWKPGMKNKKWPDYGHPAVVIEIAKGQIDPDTNSGNTKFHAPADIRLGMLDPDGDFDGWWYDSNRLMPYEE